MRFHRILLILLILQTLFIIPPFRSCAIWIERESGEEVIAVSRSQGIGPALILKSWHVTDVVVEPGSVAPGGFYVLYFAFYLSNILLDAVLASCIVALYRIERRMRTTSWNGSVKEEASRGFKG